MSAIFQKGSSFFLAVFFAATLFCLAAHHHAEAASENLSDSCALCVLGHSTPVDQDGNSSIGTFFEGFFPEDGLASDAPETDGVHTPPARAPPVV